MLVYDPKRIIDAWIKINQFEHIYVEVVCCDEISPRLSFNYKIYMRDKIRNLGTSCISDQIYIDTPEKLVKCLDSMRSKLMRDSIEKGNYYVNSSEYVSVKNETIGEKDNNNIHIDVRSEGMNAWRRYLGRDKLSFEFDDEVDKKPGIMNVYELERSPKKGENDMPVSSDCFGAAICRVSYYHRIKTIYENYDKRTVVVVWDDGRKTKVKCSGDDFYNIYNAVAAATMIRKYGTNNQFKAHVNRAVGGYDEKAYWFLAFAETSEFYNGKWKEFVAEVDKKLVKTEVKEETK